MDEVFDAYASQVLKDLIYNRRLTYLELAKRLGSQGIPIGPRSLANKINRGTFSFSFFIRCLAVMNLSIDKVPWDVLAAQNAMPDLKSDGAKRIIDLDRLRSDLPNQGIEPTFDWEGGMPQDPHAGSSSPSEEHQGFPENDASS